MNINLLKTYIKVVETQNLSKTADEFGLSQPAVTKQIQTLEDMYGVLLLERSGRRLKTTEAGETLYICAREVIKAMDKMEKAMGEVAESRKGKLYLGASTIPGQYLLPQFIKEFKDDYPNITISMDIGDTDKIFTRVAEREIDLGVVGGWTNNRKVDGFKWLEDELVIIVPQGHHAAGLEQVDLNEMIHEKWIFREKGSGTRRAAEELMAAHGIKKEDLNVYMEAGSTEAVLASVESGMGVSIISRLALNNISIARNVAFVKIASSEAARSFYVIYPKQKSRRNSVNNFIAFLKSKMV